MELGVEAEQRYLTDEGDAVVVMSAYEEEGVLWLETVTEDGRTMLWEVLERDAFGRPRGWLSLECPPPHPRRRPSGLA